MNETFQEHTRKLRRKKNYFDKFRATFSSMIK